MGADNSGRKAGSQRNGDEEGGPVEEQIEKQLGGPSSSQLLDTTNQQLDLPSVLNLYLRAAVATIATIAGDKKASDLTEEDLARVQEASLSALGDVGGAVVQLNTASARYGRFDNNRRHTIDDRSSCKFKLVFSHVCEYLGCNEPTCVLCRSNPNKMCTSPFDSRYYVSSRSRAGCGGVIVVDLVDSETGSPVSDLPCVLHGRLVVLDKEKYSQTGSIEASMVTLTKKNQPLLKEVHDQGIDVQCETISLALHSRGDRTCAVLPPFAFMSSSESVLEGKKNLFQLGCVVDSAEMLGKAGSQMSMSMSSMDVEGSLGSDLAGRLGSVKPGQVDPKDVAPAVASRRLKNQSKSNIPFVNDTLHKLKHLGDTAVGKLASLGKIIDSVPKALASVTNVGQFKALIQLANNDQKLKAQMLSVLKLNSVKWDEVSEQALRCVQKDNRVRVWWPQDLERDGMRVGFVFGCDCGRPDLTIPIGHFSIAGTPATDITSTLPDARKQTMNLAHHVDHRDLRLMDFIKSVSASYRRSWKSFGHPNWSIGDLETDRFLTNKDQCMMLRVVSNASGILQHPAMQFPTGGHCSSDSDQVPRSAFALVQAGQNANFGPFNAPGLRAPLPLTVGAEGPGSGQGQGALLRFPSMGLSLSDDLARVLSQAVKDGQLPVTDEMMDGRGTARANSGRRPSTGPQGLPSMDISIWKSDDLDNTLSRALSIEQILYGSSNSYPLASLTQTNDGGTGQELAALSAAAQAIGQNLGNRTPSVNQAVEKKSAAKTDAGAMGKRERDQDREEDAAPNAARNVSLELQERIDCTKPMGPPPRVRRRKP